MEGGVTGPPSCRDPGIKWLWLVDGKGGNNIALGVHQGKTLRPKFHRRLSRSLSLLGMHGNGGRISGDHAASQRSHKSDKDRHFIHRNPPTSIIL